MKFKVFFILSGVIILHAIILTGVSLTGGCNAGPVLEPRAFIPAPDGSQTEEKIANDQEILPKIAISQTTTIPEAPVFKMDATDSKLLSYSVKKNDSFWKIARKHGVTMQALAAYNNLPLNKTLRVGQKLKIPPGGYVVKNIQPIKTSGRKKPARRKPIARPSDGTYTVKSGDSFWKIAKRYNLRTRTLLDANNMTGRETLRIGQKLIIPDGKNSISTAPTTQKDANVKSILDSIDANIDDKTTGDKSAKKVIADDSIDDDSNSDRAVQVIRDIKVEDFAKQYKVTPAMLKKLNDDYPANGILKAGSVVIIRSAE